jgi:hypothetical protein
MSIQESLKNPLVVSFWAFTFLLINVIIIRSSNENMEINDETNTKDEEKYIIQWDTENNTDMDCVFIPKKKVE